MRRPPGKADGLFLRFSLEKTAVQCYVELKKGLLIMENRVAVIAVIVEKVEKSGEVNAILHEYNEFVIGRMGLPYRSKNVYIINIVVDAAMDRINALAGKLGRIEGVTAKAVYSGIA